MSRAVLACEALARSFGADGSRVTAVRGVSFALQPGDVAILTGPSGSGKSTLLSLAGGLLTPDGGSVRVAGMELATLGPDARRRALRGRVGYVFQRCLLLPELSALENVVLALRFAGLSWGAAEASARELLRRLGLGERLGARPAALSGGEQQRVAIARAIGAGPRLLLADEPTASLDWTAGRAALAALVALARERDTAVLLATHDERVLAFGTRLLRLRDGVLVEDAVLPRTAERT